MSVSTSWKKAGVAAIALGAFPLAAEGWASFLDRRAVNRAVARYARDAAAAVGSGTFSEAELAVRGALELSPRDPELRLELIRVHALWVANNPERLDKGADIEALRYGLKLLGVDDGTATDARLWVAAGHLALRAGGQEAASQQYQEALKRDPKCVEAHLAMGALHHALGKKQEALADYEAAFAQAPNRLQVINNLGVEYVDAGRVEDGIKMFERAVAVQDNAASRINLGNAFTKAGRAEDGIKHFERAAHLAPESQAIARRYGGALMQAGKYADAAKVLSRSLEREPDAEGAMTLALAHQALGSHDVATTVLRQLLTTNPQVYAASYLLAASLDATGEKAGAVAAYERFLRSAPANDPRRAVATERVAAGTK